LFLNSACVGRDKKSAMFTFFLVSLQKAAVLLVGPDQGRKSLFVFVTTKKAVFFSARSLPWRVPM